MSNTFNFPRIAGAFQMLLALPWQESPSRPEALRIPTHAADKTDILLMSQCNDNFGYSFKNGASPSLGQIYMIDPVATQAYGSYKHPANHAFVLAHSQIQAGHHTIENAAKGLALHAGFQELYAGAGVLDDWGPWALGFNMHAFNIYKMDPRSPSENAFLQHAHHLLNPMTIGKTGVSDLTLYTDNTHNVCRLKIVDRPETYKVLAKTHDKLAASLQLCAHAGPDLQEQVELRHKLHLRLAGSLDPFRILSCVPQGSVRICNTVICCGSATITTRLSDHFLLL